MVEYNKDLTLEEANAKLKANESQMEPQDDNSQV